MSATLSAANDNLREREAVTTTKLEAGRVITTVQSSPPGVRVRTLIGCSPEDMLALLTDYAALPHHIHGLNSADVLQRDGDTVTVQFTMKLPFPVGRVQWTNRIRTWATTEGYSIEWTLTGGDLEQNDGRLDLTTHGRDSELTHADYSVRVQSRTKLPKSAERLATRWLLPKIVGKLRRVAENQ